MIDEGELRSRFPEIPWDQPVSVSVLPEWGAESGSPLRRWVCRYCIAMRGISAQELLHGKSEYMAHQTRDDALDHIEMTHHD